MKCTCEDSGAEEGLDDMQVIAGYDDPNKHVAFCVHYCPYCGAICKKYMWGDDSEFWIDSENNRDHLSNSNYPKCPFCHSTDTRPRALSDVHLCGNCRKDFTP